MSLYWNGEPESLHWGGEVSEVYQGSSLVWSAVHPLIRSEPNHWFSLEDDAHWYDRGSDDSYLNFASGSFANRGDFVWSSDAASRLTVPNDWKDGFTLSGWFQITGRYGSSHYFFSRYDLSSAVKPFIDVWVPGGTGGRDALGIRLGDMVERASLQTEEGVVPLGEWFHLSIVCENKDPLVIQAYINGQLVHEFDFRPAGYGWPLVFSPESSFSIASYAGSVSPGLMDGNIDDAAIWSRPLSAAEVGSIYRAGPVPTEKLPAPVYQEQEVRLTATGGVHHQQVPTWCKFIDIILLGGGAGGAAGNGGNNGNGYGGGAGSYTHATVERPGDLSVSVRVGSGGRGSYTAGVGNQENGESSILYIGGSAVLEAAGGIRHLSSNRRGLAPGNRSFAGGTITGGTGATGGGFSGAGAPPGGTSTPPGAGGPGGTGGLFGLYQHGGAGARGEVWMRMRSGPRQ